LGTVDGESSRSDRRIGEVNDRQGLIITEEFKAQLSAAVGKTTLQKVHLEENLFSAYLPRSTKRENL
jgi:hypothetical protein